jgi:hypothetical protein
MTAGVAIIGVVRGVGKRLGMTVEKWPIDG